MDPTLFDHALKNSTQDDRAIRQALVEPESGPTMVAGPKSRALPTA